VGYQGAGFRLLSSQLTSDLHLTPRTGGPTRIISRETSCQVQPGRRPRSSPPAPRRLSLHTQDSGSPAPSSPPGPGVPAPSFLPQEWGPASEPQRLTMGHYTCAFQVVSGSEWKEKKMWGWRECVCSQGEAGPGSCWNSEAGWSCLPSPPALSSNSSPQYVHYPTVGQGSRKELQFPGVPGQADSG
jgi:hypothetical protein